MSERALDPGRRLRLADRVLDLQACELRTLNGRPVALRRKSLEVLLLLAEHAGQVVDKGTLLEQVWPGVVVGDDSLTQTIVDIRRAIGDRGRQVVSTVVGRGYRLQPTESFASLPAPALSIAVLPIAHDVADPESTRWAAVLTTELTSRAGVGLSDSMVVARETVAAAGAALSDPRVAARQLGVQQVVCGDLRTVPGGWSLVLCVVDGVSGARRWSHRFVLEQADLSEQIDRVTAQAARALIVEMHRTAAAIAASRPSAERSADDLALQGWACIYSGISPDNLERAQHLFEQAVEKDPSHRRGLGGLCISNHWRALMGWAPDRQQAQRRVIDAALRLEKLHPNDKLTALASGSAADVEQRWDLRLSIGDHLCERDPADPTAHFARGLGLLRLGRFDECLREIDQALRMSVDDFRAGWWYSIAACAHLMSARHRPAQHAAQQAIAANACLPLPPLLLAAALAGDGQLDEGREVLRQHRLRVPHCNRSYIELLLGGGDVGYQQGCARMLSSLKALGIPDA